MILHSSAQGHHKNFIDNCDKRKIVTVVPPTHYAANIKTIFNELEAVVGPRVARYARMLLRSNPPGYQISCLR